MRWLKSSQLLAFSFINVIFACDECFFFFFRLAMRAVWIVWWSRYHHSCLRFLMSSRLWLWKLSGQLTKPTQNTLFLAIIIITCQSKVPKVMLSVIIYTGQWYFDSLTVGTSVVYWVKVMLLAACRLFVSIVFCGPLFRSLCLKFPRKHHVMMNFLSSMLRDEVCFIFLTS